MNMQRSFPNYRSFFYRGAYKKHGVVVFKNDDDSTPRGAKFSQRPMRIKKKKHHRRARYFLRTRLEPWLDCDEIPLTFSSLLFHHAEKLVAGALRERERERNTDARKYIRESFGKLDPLLVLGIFLPPRKSDRRGLACAAQLPDEFHEF